MQIRGNAPDAEIVVLGLPTNVISPIRGQASSQMYSQALAEQVQSLKGQGFQRLHLLDIPSSVMQVRPIFSAHSLGDFGSGSCRACRIKSQKASVALLM